MAQRQRKNGSTSVKERITVRSSTTGNGFTGLTSATSGLIVSTICDNEATPTVYTVAGSTIETITTPGTYANPTATKCRLKLLDDTNNPGEIEIQLADARYAVSGAKFLTITLSGVTGMLQSKTTIQLTAVDPDDAVKFGMTRVVANVDQILGVAPTLDANNVLNVSTKYVGGTLQTGADVGANTAASAIRTALGLASANLDTQLTAISSAITNLNNLSALANLFGPPILEIPDSSSSLYPFTFVVRDAEGKLVDLDASPTITATNAAGTSRAANLSAVSHPSTGVYTFTYSVASNATEEGLRIVATGAVSSEARRADANVAVADYDAVTMIAAIKDTVNHATYGNAKLVRSATPANALAVDSAGNAGADLNKVQGDGSAASGLTLIGGGYNTYGFINVNLVQILGYTDGFGLNGLNDLGTYYAASGGVVSAIITTGGISTSSFAAGTTIPRVTLADTLTTYTGNTPQTGNTYALANGANGFANIKTDTAAVKLKTDNLTSDPADASDIAASFTSIAATLATIAAYIDTEVAAIKAKTDNLPTDPADASDIAASLVTIATYIDTEVAAIKTVTDHLATAIELDGLVYRFTTNALEQAAGGGDATAANQETILELLQTKKP